MKNKAPLIIFDWDGTLCDSQARIVQCMQRAAKVLEIKVLTEVQIKEVIGLGLPESMRRLYPNLDPTLREQLKAQYIEFFLAADITPSPLFQGVEAGLAQLKANKAALAVATGKSRRGLNRVLDYHQFNDLFIATRCADETQSKPDPTMLNELLEVSGYSPHEAIMVGDTEYDMAMAETIGMPRVAVSYGVHDITRLQAYKPLVCIDHFSEFIVWLQQTTLTIR